MLIIRDVKRAGVIDPKKVVRCGLQNASSVASLLPTSDAFTLRRDPMQHNELALNGKKLAMPTHPTADTPLTQQNQRLSKRESLCP